LDEQLINAFKDQYGKRVSDALFERRLYSRDLAPVPALLVKPLFKTVPDLIVCPINAEEVSDIISMAGKRNIPVTPRAGASTVYFNSVPVRGGILMDLNQIKGIVSVDEKAQTVTVLAGTTWKDMDDQLQARGFTACSQPSSAPVATIGGWFNMVGLGIGSLKFGSLLSQVKEIQVVLPDGSIRTLRSESDPPLSWFAASEGTLGVVCQFTLKIRPLTPMRHYIIKCPDRQSMNKALLELPSSPVLPYHVHFADRSFQHGMYLLGFNPAIVDNACTVGVDYEGSEEELLQAQNSIEQMVKNLPGSELLAPDMAEHEWKDRYKALRLKRGGPSQLGGEVWLPVKHLASYLGDIDLLAAKYHAPMMSYGEMVNAEYISIMSMFYADESKTIDYILDLNLVKKIQDIGYRYGGYPYGVGLWNSPYIKRIYNKAQLAELKKRKKQLDPQGIMNPGKVYGPPLMLNSFNFAIGMYAFGVIQRLRRRGGS
jgi:glycolate oxidase